jgi:APA family basic amino acid/polyamine antiporter
VQSRARASSPDTSDRDGPLVASNRAPSAARPALPSLERRLGPLDAAAVIVSNVIGGGILFTAPQVAASVPDAWWFLFTWLAGGLLALSGAMAYAELAALRPRAGGEYVYLHAAFGPLAAFLTGWTSFVAGFSGAIAVSAVVFADYLGRFTPLAADRTALVSIPLPAVPLTISAHSLTAILVIVALSWIHFRGVGPGRVVGNLLASLKVSALVLFVVLGVSLGVGSTEHFVPQFTVPAGGWLLALVPVMFTYSGWNAASYVAEEIRDPGRNVPRALALGTGAVIAIYLALNAVYVYVFPMQTLAGLRGSVLDRVADRLLGAAAGDVMGIVAIISLAASISAMVFAGPRVYYAMARDGLFFPRAAQVHPGYRTPAVSIAAQAAWSTVLVLSAKADALVNYTGFAVVLFSGIAGVALFVLRWRHPEEKRPFRAWGYPVAPGVFVLASALIVLNAIWQSPRPSGAGVVIILAGLPLYWYLRRRRRD